MKYPSCYKLHFPRQNLKSASSVATPLPSPAIQSDCTLSSKQEHPLYHPGLTTVKVTKTSDRGWRICSDPYPCDFIADKRKAFRNVYNLLKPGGEAAILFEVDSPYHQCYRCIIESPKWSHIFKSRSLEYPQIYSENSCDAYYKRLLQDLGFTVVLCKKKQKTFAFSSDEDCIGNSKELIYYYLRRNSNQ
ncbi:methyltranfer_dom domain-containing protein [Trichonephila clavata]|uniref:Methyltranfer_dom domain-containing protein n=1 Tax=Trichonephila clavata TaxID=2740835 RepID=A0A8X6HYJ9_TRICU|nr:methyltranfer_dom domain-containing protein [Trichonephila clavata]